MKTHVSPSSVFRVTALALSLFCVPSQAQLIVGRIATPNGVPIPGVLVTGTRTFPFQRVLDTTDASGNYSLGGGLGGLNGTYNVVPSKSGYTFNPASSNVVVRLGGPDETADFSTPATVPTTYTYAAYNLTASGATLEGGVSANGAATTVRFEYGLTTAYGNVSSATNLGSGASSVIDITISNLLRLTNYHFRIVASNSFGPVVGTDSTFTTLSGVPTVQTLGPSEPGATTMKLNGLVDPNGASASAWFEVGTSSNYNFPAVTQNVGNGGNPTNVSQMLIGLVTGTTYHYRAAASTSFGTNYGADVFFTPLFNNIGAGLPGVFFSAVACGDYDNDGRPDILLTGSTAGNPGSGGGIGPISQVWRNTTAGFSNINAGLTAVAGINNGNASVAWGDYNNDGKLDILLTGYSPAGPISQVWRNMGGNFVRDATIVLPGIFDGTAAWGDFDNDGRLDILLTGHASPAPITQVWRNTGNGFVNIGAGLPGRYYPAAAWGDYNSDGRTDLLLTGDYNSPVTQVWQSTDVGFVDINAGLPGSYAGAVAWGDYDNDGRPDILIQGANFSIFPYRQAQIWRNTGNSFSNINAGLANVADGSVAWGDYDNDGWLDVLLTGSVDATQDGAITQIYHNNRDGTFSPINPVMPGVFRSSTYWADFDNDGRLDVLLTGYSAAGAVTQVWHNNTPKTNSLPTPPSGLRVLSVSNSVVTLAWNAGSDAETPPAGLTYNVRIGTSPGGSDVLAPFSGPDGLRRLQQFGNAQQRLFMSFDHAVVGVTYYWSVQTIDGALAGSAFAPESTFKLLPVIVPPAATNITSGDINADGIVDQSELNIVLSNYWPNSGWLQMTNPMKLSDGVFQFALTNASSWNLSVLVSTNLMDWDFLGPAFPVYQFFDPQGTSAPERFYRLQWP